jgi:hypothetical protein
VGVIVFEFWHSGKISHIKFQKDVLYASFSFVTFVTRKSCSVTWSACKGHCNTTRMSFMKCMLVGCREHDRGTSQMKKVAIAIIVNIPQLQKLPHPQVGCRDVLATSHSEVTSSLSSANLPCTLAQGLPPPPPCTLAKLLMKLMYSLRDTNTSPYTVTIELTQCTMSLLLCES